MSSNPEPEEATRGTITEIQGDLFDAPNGAALIHACNCAGTWGGGIAKVFMEKYPAAFKIYRDHCRMYQREREYLDEELITSESTDASLSNRKIRVPEGTALIISPQAEDYEDWEYEDAEGEEDESQIKQAQEQVYKSDGFVREEEDGTQIGELQKEDYRNEELVDEDDGNQIEQTQEKRYKSDEFAEEEEGGSQIEEAQEEDHDDEELEDAENGNQVEDVLGKEYKSEEFVMEEDESQIDEDQAQDQDAGRRKKHWIICLFTSRGYGRSVSRPSVILQNTELAIADLKDQLAAMFEERDPGPRELRACRFNSGLFGVDWALTKVILEKSELDITVVRPVGEDDDDEEEEDGEEDE